MSKIFSSLLMPLGIPVSLFYYIASSLYWWRNWFMGSINLPNIIEFQDSSKHFQGKKPVLFPVLSLPLTLFSSLASSVSPLLLHTRLWEPSCPWGTSTTFQGTMDAPICISPFICFFVSQKSVLFSYTILKLVSQPGDLGALSHSLSSLTSLTPFPSPLGFPRAFVWTLLSRKLWLSSLYKWFPNLITRSDLQMYMTGSFIVILTWMDSLRIFLSLLKQVAWPLEIPQRILLCENPKVLRAPAQVPASFANTSY